MQIGDRLVYPMHGAGEIIDIIEYEIMGQKKLYYVLQLPIGDIRIMIPTDNADNIGLRSISLPATLQEVQQILLTPPERATGSWNKRFNININRLKSGSLLEVAAVFRNLSLQDRQKKISSGERRLLDLARQIFVSELSFSMDMTVAEVDAWIEEQFSHLEKN